MQIVKKKEINDNNMKSILYIYKNAIINAFILYIKNN